MDYYLCRHCKTIANFPLDGHCEESPSGEHECVTGDDVADQVMMVWDRTPADLTNVAS